MWLVLSAVIHAVLVMGQSYATHARTDNRPFNIEYEGITYAVNYAYWAWMCFWIGKSAGWVEKQGMRFGICIFIYLVIGGAYRALQYFAVTPFYLRSSHEEREVVVLLYQPLTVVAVMGVGRVLLHYMWSLQWMRDRAFYAPLMYLDLALQIITRFYLVNVDDMLFQLITAFLLMLVTVTERLSFMLRNFTFWSLLYSRERATHMIKHFRTHPVHRHSEYIRMASTVKAFTIAVAFAILCRYHYHLPLNLWLLCVSFGVQLAASLCGDMICLVFQYFYLDISIEAWVKHQKNHSYLIAFLAALPLAAIYAEDYVLIVLSSAEGGH